MELQPTGTLPIAPGRTAEAPTLHPAPCTLGTEGIGVVEAVGGGLLARRLLGRRVAELTGGAGVRYAIDCVAGELGAEVLRCLGPRGRLVCFGTLSQGDLQLPVRQMMMSQARIEGFYLGNWLASQAKWKLLSVLGRVKRLVGTGELAACAGREFALQDYEAAFAYACSGAGKALFRMGEG